MQGWYIEGSHAAMQVQPSASNARVLAGCTYIRAVHTKKYLNRLKIFHNTVRLREGCDVYSTYLFMPSFAVYVMPQTKFLHDGDKTARAARLSR